MKKTRIMALVLAVLFALAPADALAERPLTMKSAPRSITLSAKKKTLNVGDSFQLTARVNPADAAQQVTWITSNPTKALVDQTGLVAAQFKGTVTITAYTEGGVHASCKITVKQPVTGVALSKPQLALAKGRSKTLKATVTPFNANNRKITWKSSNKKVATVNSRGKVSGKRQGQCLITARSNNGILAQCTVSVAKSLKKMKDLEELLPDRPTEPISIQDLAVTVDGAHIAFPNVTRSQLTVLIPAGRWQKQALYYNPLNPASDNIYNGISVYYYTKYPDTFSDWSVSYPRYRWLHSSQIPRQSSVTTRRGIMIGSTVEELIEAYGMPQGMGTVGGSGGYTQFEGESEPSEMPRYEGFQLRYFINEPGSKNGYTLEFNFDVTSRQLYSILMCHNYTGSIKW